MKNSLGICAVIFFVGGVAQAHAVTNITPHKEQRMVQHYLHETAVPLFSPNFMATKFVLESPLHNNTTALSWCTEQSGCPRIRKQAWQAKNRSDIVVRTLTTIPSDIGGISLYPYHHMNETYMFGGVMVACVLTDRYTTSLLQDEIEDKIDIDVPRPFSSSLLTAADAYMLLGLGGMYVGSMFFDYEHGQSAALLSYKAVGYSVLFSQLILKTVFARKRPFDPLSGGEPVEEPYTRNQFDFFNFHRPYFRANRYATAFPSFRFTMYFAVARVLQKTFNNYWVPYAICTLGLLDGFRGHDHWTSDMVAGALIGIAIGTVVTDNFFATSLTDTGSQKHRLRRYSVTIVPGLFRSSFGLTYTF